MLKWIKEWWADIKAWWGAEPFVEPKPPEDIVPDDKPTPIAKVLKKSVKKGKK